MEIYPDFRDLIGAFAAADVRYLLVGGYAVGFHGRPRFTKDLDLWVDDSDENFCRLESRSELDLRLYLAGRRILLARSKAARKLSARALPVPAMS
jgi:hypothetical protein